METYSNKIIQAAQQVYSKLGTGHSEYIYHRAMEIELQYQHIFYETKK